MKLFQEADLRVQRKEELIDVDFDEGRTTSFKGLSAGFSVELPLSDETNFGLDYSYRPADPLQSVHTFGARIVL